MSEDEYDFNAPLDGPGTSYARSLGTAQGRPLGTAQGRPLYTATGNNIG